MDRDNLNINDIVTYSAECDDMEDARRDSEMFARNLQGVAGPSRINYIPPQPCHTSEQTGFKWIRELQNGHPARIFNSLRMSKNCFHIFCHVLHNNYGLTNVENEVNYIESVGLFLYILAQGVSNRQAQERFQHSGSTISKHFHKVLQACELFARDQIIPTYTGEVPECIRRSTMYYPFFKDCIGAIDGTHVHASVSPNQIAFIGRKGTPTQNVLGVCDFNMCFTHISAGWEGSMHDSRILKEVMRNRNNNFPRPPSGKYYLVDAGYPNMKGFLAPYKGGPRYHLADFRQGDGIRNNDERFNRVHSSLRSIIERTFGVWKSRWKLLQNMPNYDFHTQATIVGVSMAIHNFIRRHDSEDYIFQNGCTDRGMPEVGDENEDAENITIQMRADKYMNTLRDQIRDEICAMY